jgi:hypothetical protein
LAVFGLVTGRIVQYKLTLFLNPAQLIMKLNRQSLLYIMAIAIPALISLRIATGKIFPFLSVFRAEIILHSVFLLILRFMVRFLFSDELVPVFQPALSGRVVVEFIRQGYQELPR